MDCMLWKAISKSFTPVNYSDVRCLECALYWSQLTALRWCSFRNRTTVMMLFTQRLQHMVRLSYGWGTSLKVDFGQMFLIGLIVLLAKRATHMSRKASLRTSALPPTARLHSINYIRVSRHVALQTSTIGWQRPTREQVAAETCWHIRTCSRRSILHGGAKCVFSPQYVSAWKHQHRKLVKYPILTRR